VKLKHFTFEGKRGVAFITIREAEALSRHLNIDLKGLTDMPISARRDPVTMWSIARPSHPLKSTKISVNHRKAWLIQARAFFGGQGKKPEPLIAWVGAEGDLMLFSTKIPLRSVKNARIRIDLKRQGEQGFLIVDYASGKPIIDKQGNRLDRILITENGLMVLPQHVWTPPKSKPAVQK
jgi:hypothetical protein